MNIVKHCEELRLIDNKLCELADSFEHIGNTSMSDQLLKYGMMINTIASKLESEHYIWLSGEIEKQQETFGNILTSVMKKNE